MIFSIPVTSQWYIHSTGGYKHLVHLASQHLVTQTTTRCMVRQPPGVWYGESERTQTDVSPGGKSFTQGPTLYLCRFWLHIGIQRKLHQIVLYLEMH